MPPDVIEQAMVFQADLAAAFDGSRQGKTLAWLPRPSFLTTMLCRGEHAGSARRMAEHAAVLRSLCDLRGSSAGEHTMRVLLHQLQAKHAEFFRSETLATQDSPPKGCRPGEEVTGATDHAEGT